MSETQPHQLNMLPAAPPELLARLWVSGVPQPRGSKVIVQGKDGVGRPCAKLRDANPKSYKWMADIRRAASELWLAKPPLLGALAVEMEFRFTRPASHFGPDSRAAPRHWHFGVPDVDKLARGVLDALSAVVYHDDSQICTVLARKVWTVGPPGVQITVMRP